MRTWPSGDAPARAEDSGPSPPRRGSPSLRWARRLSALFLLSACHDAPRDNPLDPVSTPPVELSAALDEATGTATLSWSPYAGTHPFAEYRVIRKVQGMEADTMLAAIPDPDQTAYADTTLAPGVAYQYRVVAVNASGFAAPSAWQSVGGYTVSAVELLPPEPDPLAGTLTLRWRSFQGPDFAAYQVFRRQVGTDRGERLAEVRARGDTTWVDAGPLHDVSYAYRVVVQAAGEELPSNDLEGRLALPPVTLNAAFDSRTATAALTWTPYRGPRFQTYEVRRSMARDVSRPVLETVFATSDSSVTACVDSGLWGATEYGYQVLVRTARDEEVASAQASGAFHQQLGEWPLEVEGTGFTRVQARLYARPAGGVAVLLTSRHRVRLLLLDAEGQRVEEVVLLDRLPWNGETPPIVDPRSVSVAWREGSGGLLTFSGRGPGVGLVAFRAEGALALREHEPFADQFPEPLVGEQAVVLGEASLVPRGYGYFANMEV
ncbi:MAG: fibronectin type III domain-containing protein, partial [Candidatus Latescibacterota bacterium]